MHVSIILAGASIAILAFAGKKSNPGSEIYGLVMLPVAVGFIVYSMYQYTRRAFMIRNNSLIYVTPSVELLPIFKNANVAKSAGLENEG